MQIKEWNKKVKEFINKPVIITYKNGGYFQGILYNSNTLSIAEMGKDIYVDINSKKINYIRGD